MSGPLYARPSDLVGASATITTDGAFQAGYPSTNLHDTNPRKPAKLSAGTAARIVWDFGAAQRLDGVSIPMHNIEAGDVVTLAGNASNAWGSPTLSTTITVSAYAPDGLPPTLWKDLRGVTGYSASGFRYWSLALPTNANPHALGEVLLLSQLRALSTYGPEWRIGRRDVRRSIVSSGGYGRIGGYDRGVRQARITLSFPILTDSDVDAFRALERDLRGMLGAFPLVLDPDGDAECLYVELEDDSLEETWQFTHVHSAALTLIERQRGLAL